MFGVATLSGDREESCLYSSCQGGGSANSQSENENFGMLLKMKFCAYPVQFVERSLSDVSSEAILFTAVEIVCFICFESLDSNVKREFALKFLNESSFYISQRHLNLRFVNE